MSHGTYSGTYSTSIGLRFLHDTVTSTGRIVESTASLAAVYGVIPCTLGNAGVILETGRAGIGVRLEAGGAVTNTGRISAAGNHGTGIALTAGGSIDNRRVVEANGADGVAVYLEAGGTVTNAGTLDASGLGGAGVWLVAGGSLANAGLIEADGNDAAGILLTKGGSVDNRRLVEANGTKGVAIYLRAGGTVTNGGTVEANGAEGTGLQLEAGGRITNAGLVEVVDTGAAGIVLEKGGSVDNRGTIAANGTADAGAYLRMGGTVTNSGTIEATGKDGDGVYVSGTGLSLVLNAAGGLITASSNGVDVDRLGGTVTNDGTISAGTVGVSLSGAGTVTNFGTIESRGTALRFGAPGSVLVDEAKARFIGAVAGGGGTLELAGTGGTLSGLGSQFTGFALVQLKKATDWTLAGTSTVARATTLSVLSTLTDTGALRVLGTVDLAGTLDESGALTLSDAGHDRAAVTNTGRWNLVGDVTLGVAAGGVASLVNDGILAKTGGTGLSAITVAVSNVGTIKVASGTLALRGAISGGTAAKPGVLMLSGGTRLELDAAVSETQKVVFTGSGETLVLRAPGRFLAGISGLDDHGEASPPRHGDAIDFAGIGPSGVKAVFVQSTSTDGTFELKRGTTVLAKVLLFGQYAAGGFVVAADGNPTAGSLVTYTPPAAELALAAPHH